MRKLVSELIEGSGEFRVTGIARDGLGALELIMREAPRPVVMLTAASGAGDKLALQALERGAVEFVRKPSGPISLDLATIRDELLGALRAAAQVNPARVHDPAPRVAREPTAAGATGGASNFVIAIAA